MAILRIRDADGKVKEILALKGDKGDKGDPGEFTGGELLTAHINDKNNPHGATAAQVGAAPAGYGLGGSAAQAITSIAELDGATKNGWYSFQCMGSQLCGLWFNYASVFVTNMYEYSGVWQELRPLNSSAVLKRHMLDSGVWEEWEIENPPMEFGVEYRTTERYNGKAIYVMLLNLGKLPNTGTASFSVTSGIDRIISEEITLKTNSGSGDVINSSAVNLSYGHNHPGQTNNSSWVEITAVADVSDYTGELLVKYTKV